MKKLIFILLLSISFSCSKTEIEPLPTVDFTYKLNANGNVTFNVSSANADSYEWDFGDNSGGVGRLATHEYNSNGSFVVTLKAIGKGGETVTQSKVLVNNITGTVMFYQSQNGGYHIEVSVDGKYYGLITGYQTSGSPECGGQYFVTVSNLTEGTHSFTAKQINKSNPLTWSNTFKIVGGVCSKQKLTY